MIERLLLSFATIILAAGVIFHGRDWYAKTIDGIKDALEEKD